MITDLYYPAASPIHALGAGPKLLLLFAAGTGLFFVSSPWLLAFAAALVLLLYRLGTIPLRLLIDQFRPALLVLLVVGLAQGYAAGWMGGLVAAGRLAVLLALAGLLTLTTRASAMIEAFEKGLGWLGPLGLSPAKAALALSLAIRFIPIVGAIAGEVREAQAARGLERSLFALAVPLIVRSLKMADEIADAIDARSFDAAERDRRGNH